MSRPVELMPALVRAAEEASALGQRRALALIATRLCASIGAAMAGTGAAVAGDLHQLAWAAAGLFFVALGVEVLRLHLRPEADWYEGRAVAERAKSMAWSFGVGGEPLPLSEPHAEAVLVKGLESVRATRPRLSLLLGADTLVPAGLVELRSAPLDERRQVYLAGRVQDQQRWLSAKGSAAGRAALRWRVVVLLSELVGLLLAVLWATGAVRIDAGGVASSVLVAASSWLAVRQYESLTHTYSAAVGDLALARYRLEHEQDEAGWARAVGASEGVLRKEQESWVARRS